MFLNTANAAELVVVQVAPQTGELAHYTRELRTGMQVHLDHVNANGGIRGDTVRLVSLDDQAKPEEALQQIRQAASSLNPVAFMYLIGPETIATTFEANIFDQLGIPLIGTSPAAVQLRSPTRPHVFHLTRGEDSEYEKLAQQLRTIRLRRVSLIHWDDPATMGEVSFFEQSAAKDQPIEVVARAAVPASSGQLDKAFKQIAQTRADAIISMLPVEETAKLLKHLRSEGVFTPVYGASYNESRRLFEYAGEKASRGMTVTQVVPNPFGGSLSLVRDYHAQMKKHGPKDAQHGTLSMEGFLAARLLVEALRQTPRPVSAGSLRDTLEQRGPFDLGGLRATFSDTDHVGLDFLDIGVVTFGGRLRY
ncbi:ABC transporter substrate-binding protein [Hydrogenophaga sp. 5NK40-0174]|uniref:ABC transporter substrate-binding protein n=1 Tax=Hydrogenophaga sp. 5NK40-0174 TaxID=3127649 RepID=UPI0033428720